jgi:hypothetical protein
MSLCFSVVCAEMGLIVRSCYGWKFNSPTEPINNKVIARRAAKSWRGSKKNDLVMTPIKYP